MIMNEFGYIAVTRTRSAEQQAEREHERLARTGQRSANQGSAADGRRWGIGPMQRLGRLLRALDRRPVRSSRLSRTALSQNHSTDA